MNSKKAKKLLIIFLSLAAVFLLVVANYVYKDRKFLTVNEPQSLTTLAAEGSAIGLKIGIIGDSWVAGNKLDSAIESELDSSGINAEILSSGQPGAKSRAILDNLMSEDSSPFSSNFILTNENIKYIVVVAGVNDTAGHIGADFYTHHVGQLVKVINSYNKIPLILEVPEYGIEEPEAFKSSLKHNLYRFLFDKAKVDVIADYRDSLSKNLSKTDLTYKIIPFNPVIDDYQSNKNQYSNQFHLNEQGNRLLGKYIGKYVFENFY